MTKPRKPLPPPVPFDADARVVVSAALDAAKRWGHPSLTTAHLLAGIADRAPEIVPALTSCGGSERVRDEMKAAGVASGSVPNPIPYTGRTKRVLSQARRNAFAANLDAVSPSEILTAIKEDGAVIPARLLGVLPNLPEAVHDDRVPDGELEWLSLSDQSGEPYYVQLKRQVEDAVASGQLLPGQRLPSVRHLAEAADLAPGTVARAYRMLEESGVVETAGTRGTTVAHLPQVRGTPEDRVSALTDLLRPAAVAAFHMGGSADELRRALSRASDEVFPREAV